MSLYVAKIAVHYEGTYAYIFEECSGKAEQFANQLAEYRGGELKEVVPALDYIGGGVFEICTC